MGFYDITNSSKMQFQFDKIFRNRKEMDEAALAGTDGIFQGRFVLVKYDTTDLPLFEGDVTLGYLNETTGVIYSDASMQTPYVYSGMTHVNNPTEANWNMYYLSNGNFYFKLPSVEYFNTTEQNYYTANVDAAALAFSGQLVRIIEPNMKEPTQIYYRCTGGTEGQPALWELVLPDEELPEYIQNYNIDRATYATDFDVRGYDATVWEKLQNGRQGHFVLIAYLNGMIPSLEIVPEPPSEFTSVPYIDSLSSNMLYRLHMPTTWGFRIKEATDLTKSDQTVTQNYQTYNESNQLVSETAETVNADIYLNLGGDEKDRYHRVNQNKDTQTANEVTLTQTGKSGKKYYDADGNVIETDLLELGIHLPLVGNTIDEVYDLIYGVNSGSTVRPRDVQWYSGDSSESLKRDGNSLLGGKSRDLTTIAGNLNTIHDILGQIVVELNSWPSTSQIRSFSNQYIYKYGDNYYRKGINYIPTLVDEADYTYTQQANVAESDFKRNKYYYKNGSSYVEATEYNSALGASGYYLRNINSVRYTPVDLIQFEQGQFYYKQGQNYICDQSPTFPLYPGRTYYINIVNNGGRLFSAAYSNDGRFYIYESGNYIPCYDDEPNINQTYYELSTNTINNGIAVRYYFPNCYYYKIINSDNDEYFFADDDHVFDPINNDYYMFTFGTTPHYGYDSTGRVVRYYELLSETRVDLLNPPNDPSRLFTLVNGTYLAYSNIGTLPMDNGRDPHTTPRVYYTLTPSPYTQDDLYLPGVYYYINENGSYIFDASAWVASRRYYLINSVDTVPYPFYEPSLYWYESSANVYTRSDSDRMIQNVQYYLKSQLYVYSDETNQCPYGYEWNDYAAYIPPSIVLCTMSEENTLLQMTDLGAQTSTLFGLLLKFNNICDLNEETRDSSTIGGMLNILKDLLYQITALKPGKLLYVNDFGQIESSSISIDDIKNLLNN